MSGSANRTKTHRALRQRPQAGAGSPQLVANKPFQGKSNRNALRREQDRLA